MSKSILFHFGPITVDKEAKICTREESMFLFMQEGHREVASPCSLSLSLASVAGNQNTNAKM